MKKTLPKLPHYLLKPGAMQGLTALRKGLITPWTSPCNMSILLSKNLTEGDGDFPGLDSHEQGDYSQFPSCLKHQCPTVTSSTRLKWFTRP